MNLIEYAKAELEMLGRDENGIQDLMNKNILELIEIVSKQGHSGFSINYLLNVFNKLVRFQPLTPISFEDKWWREAGNNKYQHKRNFSVYKVGKEGKPYYIEAYTMCWENNPHNCWSGSLRLKGNKRVGRCFIKDPTKMPTIKILVPLKYNNGGGDWEFSELEKVPSELEKYYDVEIIEVNENEK